MECTFCCSSSIQWYRYGCRARGSVCRAGSGSAVISAQAMHGLSTDPQHSRRLEVGCIAMKSAPSYMTGLGGPLAVA